MNKQTFEIKEEHLKLLKRMNVGWNDCEFGAPEIDPKRPYGNSSVHQDMVDILGWKPKIVMKGKEYDMDDDDYWDLPDEIIEELNKLHKEMETVLQICLCTQTFETGTYEADEYSYNDWKKVDENER